MYHWGDRSATGFFHRHLVNWLSFVLFDFIFLCTSQDSAGRSHAESPCCRDHFAPWHTSADSARRILGCTVKGAASPLAERKVHSHFPLPLRRRRQKRRCNSPGEGGQGCCKVGNKIGRKGIKKNLSHV